MTVVVRRAATRLLKSHQQFYLDLRDVLYWQLVTSKPVLGNREGVDGTLSGNHRLRLTGRGAEDL